MERQLAAKEAYLAASAEMRHTVLIETLKSYFLTQD
jgi:hypothetical protein